MTTPALIPFSPSDLIDIALALRAAAHAARLDDRLSAAAVTYDHAATFYEAASYPMTANEMRRQADACRDDAWEAVNTASDEEAA
jgi:uncharacterized membrane protein